MTYEQICFTRISGQGSGDGWQTLNASAGLSPDAAASFSKYQNGNINPPVFDADDNSGHRMAELQNDGKNVFYTLIDYEAGADDRGRSIMFAHSFVFNADEFIHEPASVLSVRWENFRFTAEQSAVKPAELTRSAVITPSQCLAELGLDREHYTALIRCIYYVLDSKTRTSLHIICDSREETIYRYMISIFSALPFELRRKVSFANHSVPNGVARTIIFDRTLKDFGTDYYINPVTGENNVLSDITLRRLSKYAFIPDEACDVSKERDAFFREMESKLALFDSAQTTSYDLYKLAYDLILEERNPGADLSPENLRLRLNELLSLPINHPFLDRQIRFLLSDIIEQDIPVNDVLAEKISRKLENTNDPDLIECGYAFNYKLISSMDIERGREYLAGSFKNRNSEAFRQVRGFLKNDEKGRKILEEYYAKIAQSQPDGDIEALKRVYYECEDLGIQGNLKDVFVDKVQKIVLLEMRKGNEPAVFDRQVRAISSVFFANDQAAERVITAFAQNEYWNRLELKDVTLEPADYYNPVAGQIAALKNAKCRDVLGLVNLYQKFCQAKAGASPEILRDAIDNYFGNEGGLSQADRPVFARKFVDECLKHVYETDRHGIDLWIYIFGLQSRFESRTPVALMIEKRIPAMCDGFAESYYRSDYLADDRNREEFTAWLGEFAAGRTEESAIASEALRVIREDEKRLRQERKRQEKEDRRDSRGSSDKSSIIGGITGLFRKK